MSAESDAAARIEAEHDRTLEQTASVRRGPRDRGRSYDLGFQVRLPPELVERVNAEAARRTIGRNKVTAAALEAWLADHEGETL